MEVVGSAALVGSSNLSFPGLTENVELNVQIAGHPVTVLQEWYEEHWAKAEDVSAEILKTIERHTREYLPFDVYSKALQEFFRGHEITAGEWEEILTHPMKDYVAHLAESEDLANALRGVGAPKNDITSTIDTLFRQSSAYRKSSAFQEMVSFMANFRDYAPYNNMLVRLQNPSCSFYASENDWKRRFDRHVKEDAHPMLILAPMHPVMLVYELDQTEGPALPKELEQFAHFEGEWNTRWIQQTVRNAAIHDRVRVDFKHLSATNAGFATLARGTEKWKMRIAVHDGLDEPSRYGVMVHELAHIYLGHLGSDKDHWWPSRSELDAKAVEIEAEAVAFIVTTRLGLKGESAAYLSCHLTMDGLLPPSVSVDLVAKAASRIEGMARTALRKRVPSREMQ